MKLSVDFHPIWILLTGLSLVRTDDISLIPNNPVVAAFVNGSYFVSCRAPKATKIIWTKGGDEITQTSGKVHIELKNDTESLDLVFESIKKKDKGDYVCKATFGHVDVEKRFNLTVFKPISFGETPVVQNATEGDNMVIRCDVGGDPTLRMSWIFRGKLVRASHRYEVTPTGLFIKDVTLDDGGDYSCRAMQTNSMVTDFKDITIKLIIQHKPRWSNEHVETSTDGFIGGKVNLSCSALAEPGADFTWIKDNRTIQTDEDVEIFNATRHLSILQISIRDQSAFGDYECRATNALGTMARVLVLSQIDPPPPPTFRVKMALADALILSIDESDLMADRRQDGSKVSLDITGYVVQYKLVDEDWDTAEEAAFDRTPGKSYTVNGLKHETEYELRVSARTAAGSGQYSASQLEKTKKWVATAAPVLDGGSASASSCTWFQRCIFGFLAVALAAASL